jgi:hypothetical protein
MNFDFFFCKMASCFSKMAFMVAYHLRMKMYLRFFLHQISIAYGHLPIFLHT